MSSLDAKLAISKALRYIASQQNQDGGFTSQSSSSAHPFTPAYEYRTTFVPSLILGTLAADEQEQAREICQHLAVFLQKQKSEAWTYNYWATSAPERQTYPYPDDLDDTFCALNALALHDRSLISEDALAAAVKILITAEVQPGGPYRTWLVAPDSEVVWLDVDIAVNANIAYFLSLVSQPLPTLTEFLDIAVAQHKLQSAYYPSQSPVLYYLSRNFSGGHRAELVKIANQASKQESLLDVALRLSSLLRLGEVAGCQALVNKLLNSQATDGSWPAAAFCLDPVRDGKTYYHGAAVLTTAFAIEALGMWDKAQVQKRNKPLAKSKTIIEAVLMRVDNDIAHLPPHLRKQVKAYVSRVARGSSGQEILGLAELFNSSLSEPLKNKLNFLDNLAMANLYGWAAYTIYDDFIDEEGQPTLLPVANVVHRRSLGIFEEGAEASFAEFVAEVFDRIDAANAWELAHCRFTIEASGIEVAFLPDFKSLTILAERSLGHLLGPVAILSKTKNNLASTPSRHIQKALGHYLIARQLNDDAHDWQADVENGHITYVVATILKDLGIRPGKYSFAKLMPRMQKQFWHTSLLIVCDTMKKQLVLSRRELNGSKVCRKDSPLEKLLSNLEVSIEETLRTQAQAERFLKAYKKSTKVSGQLGRK